MVESIVLVRNLILLHFDYWYRKQQFLSHFGCEMCPYRSLCVMLEDHKSCRVLFLKPYSLENFGHTTNAMM